MSFSLRGWTHLRRLTEEIRRFQWDFDSIMARRKIKNWKYSRFTVVKSFAVEEKLKRISTWNRVALLNYYHCRFF